MLVSPSILACDFSVLKDEIKSIEKKADFIHIDVMDGLFVNNITFGPKLVKDIKKHTDVLFDVHLMIENPIQYIEEFAKAGSDYITFHLESKSDVIKTINLIKEHKVKVGLSIKPNTSVKELEKYLPYLDLVLVMSVEPGFGGQKFIPNSLNKIKELVELRENNKYNYLIEVDGGVNEQVISSLKEVKTDIVVAGSYIFNASNREEKINSLK